MKRVRIAVAAIALSGTVLATPTNAHARNGAIALGIVGGIAAAALIGSALAQPYYYYPQSYYGYYPQPYYGYAPAYAYYPPVRYRRAYYPPAYYASAVYPRCYWRRQSVWDGFGWRLARVRVCY